MTIKVGYLGPDGATFGHQALQKFFNGRSEEILPVPYLSHDAICYAVGSKEVAYGVVAVENVIAGVVAETIRAIEVHDAHLGVKIWGEVTVPIQFFCMSKHGAGTIPTRLLSHSMGIAQCSTFVAKLRAEGVTVEDTKSTSEAAEKAHEDTTIAALASEVALALHDLKLVYPDSVTDHKNSETRFWILGKEHADPTGKDKTCFLVNLEQSQAGVLSRTMDVFAKRNISVLIVYPSPILGRQWEYTFVIEVRGHVLDSNLNEAWEEFRSLGLSLHPMHTLGSYPDVTSK